MVKESQKRNIKRKMYFSLIIPYILIGVIGAIYLSYMYYSSYEVQYRGIVKEKSIEIERIDRNLENCINDADRIAVEIIMNKKISNLKTGEDPKNVEHYNKAIAVRELGAIRNFNSIIQEAMVYYEGADFFLTPGSVCDYELLCSKLDITGEAAVNGKDLLTHNYEKGQMVALGKQGKELFYIRTISHRKNKAAVNVIIRFNMQKLEKMVMNNQPGDSEFLVINSEGGPVYSDHPELLEEWGGSEVTQSRSPYILIEQKGENTGLIYQKYVDNSEIKKSLRFQVFAYLGIAACFLLLIGFGYASVRRNYREIEILIKKLSVLYKKDETLPDTEIAYMQNAVSYLEGVIRKQGVVVTEDAIKKAVYGIMTEDDEIYTWLTEDKGLFAHGSCILALIERDQQEAEEAKLNFFIMNNVIQEIFEAVEYCGVIPAYQYYIVVLSWNEKDDTRTTWILEQWNDMIKFMWEHFHRELTIAVSRPKNDLLELNDAYREGMIALAECQNAKKGQVICYSNLEKRKKHQNYDNNWKERLYNNLKAGNSRQVKEILTDIYQKDFAENQVTIEMGKIVLFELSQLLQQASAETGTVISLPVEEIFGAAYSPGAYMAQVMEAAELLCQNGKGRKVEVNKSKVKEIQKWIEENYADSSLSVSMLADYFDLNMTYLSRAYKEQTGGNLLNYIMTCRVEKAKVLLLKTEEPVTVIAEKTGFTNAASFNRAFKKITGITPGKFREINGI